MPLPDNDLIGGREKVQMREIRKRNPNEEIQRKGTDQRDQTKKSKERNTKERLEVEIQRKKKLTRFKFLHV